MARALLFDFSTSGSSVTQWMPPVVIAYGLWCLCSVVRTTSLSVQLHQKELKNSCVNQVRLILFGHL